MANIDLAKLRQEVDASGKDLTKPSSAGGGDFAPPAEGPTRLRLVSYIETGIHTTEYKGTPKRKPRCEIGFELSGPKHEPKVLDSGDKVPFRITVKEVVGTTAKNGYIKLFNALNTDGTAKNFLGLLMEGAWRGMVSHTKKIYGGTERTFANLKKDGAWTIMPVSFEDPETGETRTVAVPKAISEPRVFLWDYPDLDQWDSLFIDGTRDDGTSKNYIQEKIKSAENFVGSPIYNLLIESNRTAETVPAAKVETPDDGGEEDEGEAKPDAASLTEPAPTPPPAKAPVKAPAAPKAPAKASAKATPAKTKAAPPAASGDPLQGL